MIPNPCIEVQTSPEARPSVPPWFAEVVIIAHHLTTHDLLDAFAQQIRLVRGRFGSYEPIYFLALQVGYAISGERTLCDFFERITPFETAFMALDAAQMSATSLQFESLPGRCGSSLREIPSVRSLNSRASQKGGHRKPLAGCSIVRVIVTSSSMSMRRARPHGNERSLAILRYLLPDADSMRFVHPATQGASAVKWYGPEPQPFKCILVNGSAPMQARAMVTIVTNSLRHCKPSPPT